MMNMYIYIYLYIYFPQCITILLLYISMNHVNPIHNFISEINSNKLKK